MIAGCVRCIETLANARLTQLVELQRLGVDVLVVEQAAKRALGLVHEHLAVRLDFFGHLLGLRDYQDGGALASHVELLLLYENQSRAYILKRGRF
jgi:hypothetical protein